ncbi:oxidoreductase alpha (molybdopterin) subunit [Cyclobacterium lianum]|uniref:Oxidoreductase alpha (Molybdopterin) subunit n=1 Tax=Cyclobacterium lianum TaxID=388280 RepID=A0A1M7NRN8_9BACT|nr:FdhF/YdeP family oxidoreductase [Cyclobacterium lianum]SHN06504.1 oxidoreductase alpha (molybdopterin) subunit [Cyclobacterium lianum]
MNPKRKVKLSPPGQIAAGMDSIQSVARAIWEETHVGRGVKTLFKLNQPKGFDCPSCAWPDPDPDEVSKIAEYCENGAKAVAWENASKKIDATFFQKNSVEELFQQSDHWLEKQGRLTQPMVLKPGASHYHPISWEEAFDLMAEKLHELDHPDQAIFYTSGRTSNEAAFLYQCFVRQFGTNNLPDCSNMCHEASGKALSETLGIGKASVILDDIRHADLLLVMGQNPGTNAPRMLTAMEQLKKNGGKIISINPLPETGLIQFRNPQKPWEWLGKPTTLHDLHLQVKVSGDLPLLKAILKMLLAEDKKSGGKILDHTFIAQQTSGYEALLEHLETCDLEKLIDDSGVAETQLREAVQLLAENKNIIIAWAMGITQHRNAENTIREIVNILLVKGAIGKKGAGTLPVRGHSNVQGDRTMGIWEKMSDAFLDRLGQAFSFEAPRNHGVHAVGTVEALASGKAKVFMGMGGNFVLAAPDTQKVFEGMRQCSLTVHVSTKLNRSHLVHGETALILPCLGRTEADITAHGPQFVSTEDTAGRIRMSSGDLEPGSDLLKSEVAIICGLARKVLGTENATDWEGMAENYDLIRDKIEAVIPGFEAYNERVRVPGGFYLPNGAREGSFYTEDRKAHLTVNPLAEKPDSQTPFILMTVRSHDQFNTTVYGYNDRYRGIQNSREVVMMHREDMKERGYQSGDLVKITSVFNGEKRVLEGFQVVPYDISRGCLAVYFPEGNVLVALDNRSGESHCPASKFIEVFLEKMQA